MTVYTNVEAIFEKLQMGKNAEISRADLEESFEKNPLLLSQLKEAKHKTHGFGLVHAAVTAGNYEVAEFLLEKGVNPNIKSNSGATALHLACFQGNATIITSLLIHGANVKAVSNKGITPLHDLADSKRDSSEKKRILESICRLMLEKEIVKIISEHPFFDKHVIDDQGNLSFYVGDKQTIIPATEVFERFKMQLPEGFAANENFKLAIANSMYNAKQPYNKIEPPKVKTLPHNRILYYDEWLKEKYNVIARSERNSLAKTHTSGINYVFSNLNDCYAFGHTFCPQQKKLNNIAISDPIYDGKKSVLLEGAENEKVQSEYQDYLQEMKVKMPRSESEIQDQIKEIERAENTINTIDKIDLSPDYSSNVAFSRQIISAKPRLDEFQALTLDNKALHMSDGYYHYKATSAYKLSLEAYLALHKDCLDTQTYKVLKEASLTLMGENGDVTKGLKADANWIDYLDVHRSDDGNRLKYVRNCIIQDAKDLLFGNPKRLAIDKHVPVYDQGDIASSLMSNMNYVGKGTPRNIPRFFPDEQGNSETDSFIIQAGGMRGHSTMVKIWKQGVDINGNKVKENEKPHHYKFYRTEYNAGAGAHDVNWIDGTCNAIYTTQIIPNWEYKQYPGKELQKNEIPDPKKDLKKYYEIMNSTLTDLIITEREIKFFEPAKLGPNGEVAAKNDHIAKEWEKRDLKIKARSGTKVDEFCHLGILQRSGNCSIVSQRQMLRGQFFANNLEPFVIEDHWAFAQSNGNREVMAKLKAKKMELKAELEIVQKAKKHSTQDPIQNNLALLLKEYAEIQKSKVWSTVKAPWEIGRSNYSGNAALANADFQYEFDNGNITVLDKKNGYKPINFPDNTILPMEEIKLFIEMSKPKPIDLSPPKVKPLVVNPKIVNPSIIPQILNPKSEEFKALLLEYAQYKKDSSTSWVGSNWKIQVDNISKKVLLTSEKYLVEVQNDTIICKDKKMNNQNIELPFAVLPLKELQAIVHSLKSGQKPNIF